MIEAVGGGGCGGSGGARNGEGMMEMVVGGLILFAAGFVQGWVARSWIFWRDEDCANPEHKSEE